MIKLTDEDMSLDLIDFLKGMEEYYSGKENSSIISAIRRAIYAEAELKRIKESKVSGYEAVHE